MISKYERISAAVSSIYHDIQRLERQEMTKYGLKGPQAQCLLAMLRHPEGITASQLCVQCEKDKAAISRILAELERSGLVLRHSPNGSKYRALLTLTNQGRAAAATVSRTAQRAVAQAGAGLTEEKREVFYQVLGHIAENLHTICKEGIQPEEAGK